jgi:hypothetical protein
MFEEARRNDDAQHLCEASEFGRGGIETTKLDVAQVATAHVRARSEFLLRELGLDSEKLKVDHPAPLNFPVAGTKSKPGTNEHSLVHRLPGDRLACEAYDEVAGSINVGDRTCTTLIEQYYNISRMRSIRGVLNSSRSLVNQAASSTLLLDRESRSWHEQQPIEQYLP